MLSARRHTVVPPRFCWIPVRHRRLTLAGQVHTIPLADRIDLIGISNRWKEHSSRDAESPKVIVKRCTCEHPSPPPAFAFSLLDRDGHLLVYIGCAKPTSIFRFDSDGLSCRFWSHLQTPRNNRFKKFIWSSNLPKFVRHEHNVSTVMAINNTRVFDICSTINYNTDQVFFQLFLQHLTTRICLVNRHSAHGGCYKSSWKSLHLERISKMANNCYNQLLRSWYRPYRKYTCNDIFLGIGNQQNAQRKNVQQTSG